MQLPILCYHKVSPDPAEGRWLNVHPKRLKQHLSFFARRGYSFHTAHDLGEKWSKRGVCFTFDDAYTNAMEFGVEALSSVNAKATFYVVSERVGTTSSWDADKAAPLAGWDVLMQAHEMGHEIGNHTANHVHMDNLNIESQIVEIQACKEALAEKGILRSSFCFPYGSHSPASATALKKCGYNVGVVIGKRPALPSDPLLALPRIVMAYGDSLPMLLYKLNIRPRLK